MRLYHMSQLVHAQGPVHADGEEPEPGRGEVRVRIEAASLNFRDLLVLDGAVQGAYDGRIPLSDGAGVIDAIGPGVGRWRVGDRVVAAFFRDWIQGPFKSRYLASALGGSSTDGVLAEKILLPEQSLVAIPAGYSAEQAATLPCAAVTAWQALFARGGLQAGDTLLVQGTGGVALFGLQFAVAAGARVIVISSSDQKLARARDLGAQVLINYRATPEWDKAVREQTDHEGASFVLELGGPATYERSLRALAFGGRIAQIGVLTGVGPQPNLARLQSKNADILGITVGSVAHFEAMNAFIERHGISPVIDRIFAFDEAVAAYAHLRGAQHFGKVVVRL